MSEKRVCEYCHHAFHGVAEREGDEFSGPAIPPATLCTVIAQVGEDTGVKYLCNCDGRTQCFPVFADTHDEAEALAIQIEAAGYKVYRYDGKRAAVQPFNANWEKSGRLTITVYSNTLPPVASRAEFMQRVGL